LPFTPPKLGATLLATACLAGCTPAQKPVTAAVSPRIAHPPYSLDTPVEKIAADPLGRAVLTRDIPRLMSSSSYILFEDMSLAQIATVSGGRLTRAKLDLIEADLSRIPAQPK
jgi:hypothetical protein